MIWMGCCISPKPKPWQRHSAATEVAITDKESTPESGKGLDLHVTAAWWRLVSPRGSRQGQQKASKGSPEANC